MRGLINPSNPLVGLMKVKESRWNRYRSVETAQPIGSRGSDATRVGKIFDLGREPRRGRLSGNASARL